jgi:para-aminobenzoate synthetase component I
MPNKINRETLKKIKSACYHLLNTQSFACVLDSNELPLNSHGKYEFMAAFGNKSSYTLLEALQNKIDKKHSWLFGVISYSYRKFIEPSTKAKLENPLNSPDFYFFEPANLVVIDRNLNIVIQYGDLWDKLDLSFSNSIKTVINPSIKEPEKDKYLKNIKHIKRLIYDGEVYEMNFCIPYKTQFESINYSELHLENIQNNPVPMSAWLRINEHFISCASMERFIQKIGNKIISQPIKGTSKRGKSTSEDHLIIQKLQNCEKERAENVMIVDLVRNDLSKVCQIGTIKVEELFKIYTFPLVHQMISTISGQLNDERNFSQIIQALFPMGSMTGAPKIAVQNWINELEDFERGWYSGTLGYIEPNTNFDFNVIIRSIVGNSDIHELDFYGGGAITIDSIAENEWKEIETKVIGMKKLISKLSANE